MPTVLQTKYYAGASPGGFDDPLTIGHRLVLWQSARDTPTAGDIAFLEGQGWTHLATCTNATGFERGGAIYWKSAEATNESWNLDAPDLEYILIETNATVETPVVVGIGDTQASSASMNCGGSFTPEEGDDFLAIGGASVGASDQDYDTLPNPLTPYDGVDEGPEPGGTWNSFSPLMWVGWLSDASASGSSYVVGATNARPRTYCGITILLASSPPEPPVTPPFVCVLDDADLSELECVTSDELEDFKIRVELQGTGAGTIVVNRSAGIVDAAVLKSGNWCAVTIPQIQSDPIFLVQIETGDVTLVSFDEEGGEVVSFGGRGPLSYLERVKAYPRAFEGGGPQDLSTNGGYLHGPASTGNKAGQILNRSIEEWQSTDRGVADFGERIEPIQHLTRDFDYDDDSDGNTWATTAMTAELSQGYVGETGLQGILELIGTGEIDILMWPDLSMQAFNAYGRDLTATSFAADKVIFRRGVNIAEALKRSFGTTVVPNRTIIQGESSTWAFAESPTAGTVPDVEGYVSAPGTDTAALEEIGLADMRRRLRQGESVQFQIKVPRFGQEPDPASGLYLPGPPGSNGHFWIGDTVTLDTGDGFHDFDNTDARVMAITITIDDAGDLIVIPELKATTLVGRFGATTGTPGGGGFGVGFGASAGGTGGGTPAPPPPTAAIGQHVADPTDAHDASAVSVLDTGGNFTGTNVETVLAEIFGLLGSADAILRYGGAAEWFQDHGAVGATETIDLADGNVHHITLDANCTLTFTGAVASIDGQAVHSGFLLYVEQNGTGGWDLTLPGSVVDGAALSAALDQTASTLSRIVFTTPDGGTTWYGDLVGGSDVSPLSVEDEGVEIDAAVVSQDFVGAGVTVTSTGAGAVEVAIPGGATASDTGIWRPLMDGAGAVITDETGQAVMAFGPA